MDTKRSFLAATIGFFIAQSAVTPAFGQDEEDSSVEDGSSLEEIIVTGRKREESLQDIPVSISVLTGDALAEQNVLSQDDLAELIPGLHYNQGGGPINDRIAALPSIRGVSATEIATNFTKVASFVDGMPILGSVGSINIGGSTQVEVYNGPQSAAFGRSTFAGAINYVTADPGDELSGSLGVNWSNLGTRIISASIGGPLTDTIGFQLGGNFEDTKSPDSDLYSYSDGVEASTRGGKNLSARLVFEPTDNLKVKLTFSHDETDDGPQSNFYATQASAAACFNSLGNTFAYTPAMGPDIIGVDGVFDCELDVEERAGLLGVNDIARYYDQNPDELAALVATARADGATDGEFADYTVEEAIKLVAAGLSVPFDDVGSQDERDRVSAQFDYVLDNGSVFQVSLMKSKEEYIRQQEPFNDATPEAILYTPAAPESIDPMSGAIIPATTATFGYSPDLMGRTYAEGDPSSIDENYVEIRWASPAEQRLRYLFGASHYDYVFDTSIYRDGGYGALVNGTGADFTMLTGIDILPARVISEVTTNQAAFFNVAYDFTDTITASLEGRVSSDDVGGYLAEYDITDSAKSTSFAPRFGINWSPSADTTYYFQYAVGINPGGVNITMLDPTLIDSLDNGVEVDLTPNDGDPTTERITSVDYKASDYDSFDEEKLTNFEIGFKGTAFDNRLTYNGAIYHMIWEDQLQTIGLDWDYTYANDDLAELDETIDVGGETFAYTYEVDDTAANVLANSGTSEITGLELSANYLINENWSIRGNTSISNAEYSDYCSEEDYLDTLDDPNAQDLGEYAGLAVGTSDLGNTCYILDGKKLAQQPSVSVSLTPSYRTEFGNGVLFSSTARFNYSGSSYADVANIQKSPASSTLNLTFGLSKDSWSGTFYIENVLDDQTITNGDFTQLADYSADYPSLTLDPSLIINSEGTEYATINYNINEGRSYGLRLNYRF